MVRYFLWILLAALAFAGCGNPYLTVPFREMPAFFTYASLLLLLLAFLPSKHQEVKIPRFSNLNITLILFFTWPVMGYFYSVRMDYSFPLLTLYLGAILFILAMLLYLQEIKQIEEIFWVLSICAVIHVLFALFQQTAFSIRQQHQLGMSNLPAGIFTATSQSLFLHANFFGGYLLFHLPITLYLFFSENTKNIKIIAAVFFVLLLIGVGISGSPGGQIVAMVQILALAGYFFRKRQLAGLKLLGAGALLAILFCVAFTQVLYPKNAEGINLALLERRPWNPEHLISHLVLWQTAWDIFKDYWITGSGPNTFVLLHPSYLMKTWIPVGLNVTNHNSHAHILYLQIASDMGIIGVGLFLACIYLFYSKSIHIFREREHPGGNMILFLGVGFSGFLIHNVLDHIWNLAVFIYYFALWILLVDFIHGKSMKAPVKRRLIISGLALGYGTIAVIAGTCLYHYIQETQYKLQQSTTIEAIETHIYRARLYCPKCEEPFLIKAERLILQSKKTGNLDFLPLAEDAINKVDLAYNPEALLFLAEIRVLQNQLPEARKIYSRVIRFGRHSDIALRQLDHIKTLMDLASSSE